MIVQDQSEIIAFLGDPANHAVASHAPAGDAVRQIHTHGAVVFLAGPFAYKMKRAVRFSYMDFSTLARRRQCCQAEVALNGRLAPELYLGVVPVSREADGGLALDGAGPPCEWLVKMRRFDEATLFNRLAEQNALTPELMRTLADVVFDYLDGAEVRPDGEAGGGLIALAAEAAEQFRPHLGTVFASTKVERLRRTMLAQAERHQALMSRRCRAGFVRLGHGDLHLRNICLFEGRPTLFDAIEFNPRLAIGDVYYELAFLLMDLLHRGHPLEANIVLNRYLELSGDIEGLAPLGLYLSLRAAIRAHVSAAMCECQTRAAKVEALQGEARGYLDQALAFLAPAAPRLVAIGGLSGSGKTALAQRLAPLLGAPPGALVLRSDVIRKSLAGLAPEQRLPARSYTREAARRVYQTLHQRSAELLAAGHSVIVDAVQARPEERAAIAALAAAPGDAGLRFDGLWLEAPRETAAARIIARLNGASDATPAVLQRQRGIFTGAIDWHVIDAAGPLDGVVEQAKAGLTQGRNQPPLLLRRPAELPKISPPDS